MRERLVTDFLDTLILLKMKNKPLTGNDIISYVHKRFDVLVRLGTVYSCLHHLEKEELIIGKSGLNERIYSLTEKGRETAESWLSMRNDILGIVVDLFTN
jgi:DNA-binding PadR family transcriptional regulator